MFGCLGKTVGLFLILAGLYGGLMVLAFGSMIDPTVTGTAWWMEYGSRIWKELIVCLAKLLVGLCLLFGPQNRWDWNRRGAIEEPEHFLDFNRQKSF